MDERKRDSIIAYISATALDDFRIRPDDLASALATAPAGPDVGRLP
jgi:DNA-binding protein H-NS